MTPTVRCLDCNEEYQVLANTRQPIIRCPFCGSGLLDPLPSPRHLVGNLNKEKDESDA